MGMYKYVREAFEKNYAEKTPAMRQRLQAWRRENEMTRVEKPTNVTRAREIGYKAKKGYFIVRVCMKKGLRKRPKRDLGRKPGRDRFYLQPGKSWQWNAEQRVWRAHRNAEILGSYFVGGDGSKQWFEVVLRA